MTQRLTFFLYDPVRGLLLHFTLLAQRLEFAQSLDRTSVSNIVLHTRLKYFYILQRNVIQDNDIPVVRYRLSRLNYTELYHSYLFLLDSKNVLSSSDQIKSRNEHIPQT